MSGREYDVLSGYSVKPRYNEGDEAGGTCAYPEYELLKFFLSNQRRVLSREILPDHIWEMDYEGDIRTVDTTVLRLRRKIGEDMIRTRIGPGFQKFWLWDQDYEMAMQGGSRFRLYSQSRMNDSILVRCLPLESGLYAIAAVVPDAQGGHLVISIVNHIGFLIYSFAVMVAALLIFILTRHITKPLAEVCVFTGKVSAHDYQPLQIRTGDEPEAILRGRELP